MLRVMLCTDRSAARLSTPATTAFFCLITVMRVERKRCAPTLQDSACPAALAGGDRENHTAHFLRISLEDDSERALKVRDLSTLRAKTSALKRPASP
jgi:hypothetical protein